MPCHTGSLWVELDWLPHRKFVGGAKLVAMPHRKFVGGTRLVATADTVGGAQLHYSTEIVFQSLKDKKKLRVQ